VQDAAAVHAAVYAELKGVQCATVRGGVVATAAVCPRAMGNAGAAMRAAARASLNCLARVALCGDALVMAPVCVEAFFRRWRPCTPPRTHRRDRQDASFGSPALAGRPPHRNLRSLLVQVHMVHSEVALSGHTGA